MLLADLQNVSAAFFIARAKRLARLRLVSVGVAREGFCIAFGAVSPVVTATMLDISPFLTDLRMNAEEN
eukprot:CAMPEP_0172816814 /NCGR_PEP_ID=MMETSP1075-20121228/12736_1 /TAXON_ID=2916 /ORGANISM="Ceratium fusus, Strain PA161109" /LENGTH=68 /DNA_ID=CAMNT_0013656883 /DNA_START=447 /DNA_END=653 /DNA_ORIENTATION=+